MARRGQTIENPLTGERITFVRTAADTGGALLELDDLWTRADHHTPLHVHPGMEERWEIRSGVAGFRIGGVQRIASPGEVVIAPAGIAHEGWNAGDEPVRLRLELRPALRWEDFVVRLFDLAADERTAGDGRAILALVADFEREIALPGTV